MKQYIWLYLGEQALVHEIANEWPPRNFSQLTREQRSAKRLGAFEVDARLRVDGRLETISLWSKLAEQRWPQWGGDDNWQERLRRDLPIFHLGLQPCATQHEVAPQQSGAALAGVTHRAVAGLTVAVYNHDRSSLIVTQERLGPEGLSVKLLRGTYWIDLPACTDPTTGTQYYKDSVMLNLVDVPAPPDDAPIPLPVPMFARPKLDVRIEGPSLELLPEARLGDVLVRLRDARTGERLADKASLTAERITIDLEDFRDRIPNQASALEAELRRIILALWRNRLGREPNAMETMGAGTSPTRSSPPRVAGTPGRPRAGWAEKEDSGGSDDEHFTDAAAKEAASCWLLEVEASLPKYESNAPLQTELSCRTVRFVKGGAAEVVLTLTRARRPVRLVLATAEAELADWRKHMGLPALRIGVRHAKQGIVATQETAPMAGGVDGADAPVAECELTGGLIVGETYTLEVGETERTAGAAETVAVKAGKGELSLRLMPRRKPGVLRVQWTPAHLASGHWAARLALPGRVPFNVRHRSGAIVHSETFNEEASSAAAVTEVRADGALFVGETYSLEVPAGAGVQAQEVPFRFTEAVQTVAATLHRETAAVHVVLLPEAVGGAAHWAASLPLPPGIGFEVAHKALNVVVDKGVCSGGAGDSAARASGVGDRGDAAASVGYLSGAETMFVGQTYELRIAGSEAVEPATASFTVLEGSTEVVCRLRRRSFPIKIEMRMAHAGGGHWSAPLQIAGDLPALRVHHKKTGALAVGHAAPDASGAVIIGDAHSPCLFAGETYVVEVPAGSRIKRAVAELTVTTAQNQRREVPIERATQDVTLSVRVRTAGGATAALPAGVPYEIRHARLGSVVAQGSTDAVAKAVIKRKGTLFVGEVYEAIVPEGNGVGEGRATFEVYEHPSTVDVLVSRPMCSVKYEILSALSIGSRPKPHISHPTSPATGTRSSRRSRAHAPTGPPPSRSPRRSNSRCATSTPPRSCATAPPARPSPSPSPPTRRPPSAPAPSRPPTRLSSSTPRSPTSSASAMSSSPSTAAPSRRTTAWRRW